MHIDNKETYGGAPLIGRNELADKSSVPPTSQPAQVEIDDSKATNEGAAIASISAIDGSLILIAGGDAKGGDLRLLAQELSSRDVRVIAMGKDKELIEQVLEGICETISVGSMEEAVSVAAGLAREGDTVLLAPACSSLDMFKNFVERGECFAEAVMELQS